ncbi:uncharacterized protein LOC126725890 isoform X3 [Quercus robur]|uniref:uncharacterized protein LOC126725890 isoform X3 n=1 Tax=Quercus robur TaxID=38942 RepID=UPI002161D23E|nr:uncharacterized protein LOC126725890 isoform X3 [Quercus robur]
MGVIEKWGTWEELLLGGAILRHGTRDWDIVAAELRARNQSSPYIFTPELCKAKHEDLQQRYSGCTAWFDELRKKRMEELRRALELSEDSIGSLESKLESLKAEKWDGCHVGYGSIRTESLVPFQKSEGVESSGKEISKDGLSAGSFTEETRTNWLAECQIPGVMPTEGVETKLETSQSSEQDKVSGIKKVAETLYGGRGGGVRKRRGKRKRKDCSWDVKEGSVGESEFLGLADVLTPSRCKENSISNSGEDAGSSGADNRSLGKDGIDVLMEIYNSLLENKSASVFRRRLDSQRGRYKKMIQRHMDFDTIRSRIASHSITSALELFRDLLLLSNNSLVFYSKNTREYKSALLLRDLITQKLRQHSRDSSSKATTANHSIETPMPNRTVKPRSARPANNKVPGKVANTGNAATKTSSGGKRPSIADFPSSLEYLAVTNKGFGRSRKSGRGSASQVPVAPMKGRKRVQASESIVQTRNR